MSVLPPLPHASRSPVYSHASKCVKQMCLQAGGTQTWYIQSDQLPCSRQSVPNGISVNSQYLCNLHRRIAIQLQFKRVSVFAGQCINSRAQPSVPPQPSRRIVESLAMALSWSIPDALRSAGYTPAPPGVGELTYEPIQDGPDEIIVSTAGIPPFERDRLKKLIASYIETIPRYEDQLRTYGKRKE